MQVLKADSSVAEFAFQADDKLCHCLLQTEEYSESAKHCTDALLKHPDSQIYCNRAEAHIGLDMLDEAQQDYAKALELDDSLSRAKEGMAKVQKLQKQAKKRDYYKLLNVKKNASKKEIIKAYRKQAQIWHPDNYHGDEKKAAEKKFIDIAAAKEVLTDPGKRFILSKWSFFLRMVCTVSGQQNVLIVSWTLDGSITNAKIIDFDSAIFF